MTDLDMVIFVAAVGITRVCLVQSESSSLHPSSCGHHDTTAASLVTPGNCGQVGAAGRSRTEHPE